MEGAYIQYEEIVEKTCKRFAQFLDLFSVPVHAPIPPLLREDEVA
jgi:hypothetical protein